MSQRLHRRFTPSLRQRLEQHRSQLSELAVVLLTVGLSTLLVSGIRALGGLEFLELSAYDRLNQIRPDRPPDTRILIVGITEADIQAQQGQLQFSDRVYAQVLAKLLAAQPRVIGLDIWRDRPVPPGHGELVRQLRASPRIIGITLLGSETSPTIAPPAALPPSQIGFNDVVADAGGTIVGGVVRRNLLFQTGDEGVNVPSFALQIAQVYLADQQIVSQPAPHNPQQMQFGQAVYIPLQPDSGGYVHADTRGYQVMLNYRGRSHSFPQVSLAEVLSGKVTPAQIKDKIVLIGNVAETGKDFFYTPYSSGQLKQQRMPGVVLHAHMVSQLLDAATGERPLFWDWSNSLEGLWIASWALLAGLYAWRVRHPLLLSLGTALLLTALVGICTLVFIHQSGWIPLVPPALALIGAVGGVVTYTAQQAQSQQKMVMRLLGQNTSPEVAETLWQRRYELLQAGKLPGQRLTATVLFTDLKGFSSISERLSPEALLVWLNDYLEEMTQVVQLHQGVINKFTGDGVMAVFGVPIPHTDPEEIADDAQRAVACALSMGERLQRLNLTWQQQGLPQVEMRAGIFTGPVVVGSLGGRHRLEYGVIGDSVNIASRLESLDKHRQPTPCRVLIAQETLDYLGTAYDIEAWGPLALKGKENPVLVYRIVGVAAGQAATIIPPKLSS